MPADGEPVHRTGPDSRGACLGKSDTGNTAAASLLWGRRRRLFDAGRCQLLARVRAWVIWAGVTRSGPPRAVTFAVLCAFR